MTMTLPVDGGSRPVLLSMAAILHPNLAGNDSRYRDTRRPLPPRLRRHISGEDLWVPSVLLVGGMLPAVALVRNSVVHHRRRVAAQFELAPLRRVAVGSTRSLTRVGMGVGDDTAAVAVIVCCPYTPNIHPALWHFEFSWVRRATPSGYKQITRKHIATGRQRLSLLSDDVRSPRQ